MFYFSLMMAADTEKLATDSSLSTHRLLSLPTWRCRRHGRRAHRHGRRGTADTSGVVRCGSDDARTGVLAAVPAWSNSPLLIELNWSNELLNHASAWSGN